MNRKITAVIVIIIAAVLFVYMFNKGGSAPKEKISPEEAGMPAETNAKDSKAPIVVDEQAIALEEMQREAGKSGLSKLYIVKCSACHGRDGKGPIGPSIAGKDAAYNFEALMKYKKGQVPNTMMKGLLENTDEVQLKMLAGEITAFK